MKVVRQLDKSILKKYIGQYIEVKEADGKVRRGKLVAIDGERIYIKPALPSKRSKKGKVVTSNWIFGLFLAGIVFVGLLFFAGCGWGSNCNYRRGYRQGFNDGFCHRCGRRKNRGCRCANKYYGAKRRRYA